MATTAEPKLDRHIIDKAHPAPEKIEMIFNSSIMVLGAHAIVLADAAILNPTCHSGRVEGT